jgi:hypothetical protein
MARKRSAETHKPRPRVAKPELAALVEEATVDAHDESEQVSGLFTMIQDNLDTPFKTRFLGVEITVERVDLKHRDQIMAICARGRERQAIPIVELPLPSPRPAGAEWIDAYRHWLGEG